MIHVENLQKSFRDLRRGAGPRRRSRQLRGPARRNLRPARPQRGRQDDDHAHPLHRAAADRRRGRAWPATTWRPRPAQVRQHIGFMSANTAIYDRMSAWELVDYFGRLYGMSEERLRERLERSSPRCR